MGSTMQKNGARPQCIVLWKRKLVMDQSHFGLEGRETEATSGDCSKYLDILTWEVSTILHRLLVLRILVALQQHPSLWKPSFVTLTNLAP